MKRRQPIKHHIEILPAVLLPHRREWQSVACSLPTDACLLVTDPENREQARLMLELARSFRRVGKQVVIWTMGKWWEIQRLRYKEPMGVMAFFVSLGLAIITIIRILEFLSNGP